MIFLKKPESILQKRNIDGMKGIARNHCYLLAMAKLAEEKFNFPWTFEEFFEDAMAAAHDLAERISGTDSASSFWQIVMSLVDQRVLVNGYHYKIENANSVRCLHGMVEFNKPKRILKLRFTLAHQLYMEHTRRQTGKTGINRPTLETYLRSKEYWIGVNKVDRFKAVINHKTEETASSSYVFDCDMLEDMGYYFDYTTETIYRKPVEEVPEAAPHAEPQELPF